MSVANKDAILLSKETASQIEYKQMVEATTEAILRGMQGEKAYGGLTPDQLKARIHHTMLPEHGKGYAHVLKEMEQEIIPGFVHVSSTNYMAHLHSPGLLESLAAEQMIAAFNQSMDSWDQSPIATEVEVEVVGQLCKLYGYDGNADGTFTSGGSQSNLSAILFARDWYCNEVLSHDVKKLGLPSCYADFRLYTSEISHFSMEKSCHLLGLGYQAVRKVPVDKRCKMDAAKLEAMIKEDVADGKRPFCVVATIGTTDFGSIDDVQALKRIADTYGLWLHADAAYGSAAILSGTYKNRLGDLSLCDSITLDFHKMFLIPISGSAVLVKDKNDLAPCMLHADYLNREEDEEDGYTNLVGKSIQTTRRFDALKVWVAFQTRGKDGFAAIIDKVIGNARYAYEALKKDPDYEVVNEPELSSVVFRLKGSDERNKQVRRKLLLAGTVMGQTVYEGKVCLKFTLLNPRVSHEHLDELFALIKKS